MYNCRIKLDAVQIINVGQYGGIVNFFFLHSCAFFFLQLCAHLFFLLFLVNLAKNGFVFLLFFS